MTESGDSKNPDIESIRHEYVYHLNELKKIAATLMRVGDVEDIFALNLGLSLPTDDVSKIKNELRTSQTNALPGIAEFEANTAVSPEFKAKVRMAFLEGIYIGR